MRAGRRSTISCSARCSSAAAGLRSRRPSASAGAFSKSASAPAFRCPITRAPTASSASTFRADAAQGARARRRARAPQCRGARRDGRASISAFPDAASTWSWRNTSSPRCRTRRRRSTSSRACSSPAARSFWSTTSAPRAGRASAFEHGFAPVARRLGWRPEFPWARLDALGRTARRASASSSAGRCRRSAIFR